MLSQNNYNQKDIELLKEQITFDLDNEVQTAVLAMKNSLYSSLLADIQTRMNTVKNEVVTSSGEEIKNQVISQVNSDIFSTIMSNKDKIHFGQMYVGNAEVYRHVCRISSADGTLTNFADTSLVKLKNMGDITVPANGAVMITMQTAGLRNFDGSGRVLNDYVITSVASDTISYYDNKYETFFELSVCDEVSMTNVYARNLTATPRVIDFNKLTYKGFSITYGRPMTAGEGYFRKGLTLEE